MLTPEESGARIHPDDCRAYRKAIVDHLKGVTPRFSIEYRYLAATTPGAGRARAASRSAIPMAMRSA